ncbi:MAG: spore coat associated protein CotJA [Syntrophaceticus schinkii]
MITAFPKMPLTLFSTNRATRLRLATAYVPPQMSAREMFTLREALQKGTLFPELYRPYPHHYKYPQDCEV